MTIADWMLFAYITVVLIYQAVIHYKFYHAAETILDEYGAKLTPDERGVIGEVQDDNGEEYYAIVIPKKDYDEAWTRAKEVDKK